MKITCQACQAKYTIADEKVAGKVVKIRCKKCGASIVINGNEPTRASSPPGAGGAVEDVRPADKDAAWTINVADGDQRTMTEAEIVESYRSGVVNDDTFCWREGMADWLSLQEIAPLHAACKKARPAAASGGDEEELPTVIHDTSAGLLGAVASPPRPLGRPSDRAPMGNVAAGPSGRAAAGNVAAAQAGHAATKDGNGAGAMAGPAPGATVAARRTGGRGTAADLFGGVSRAGGEDDVMTSAPAEVPQPQADGPKPIGARNENSVLFGLEKKGDGAPPPMAATNEASGLIDIRQLSAQMHSSAEKREKNARIDDIMNLGAAGGLSPALSAPLLSAPSLEHYSQPPPSLLGAMGGAAEAKNKAVVFLALGAGTFFLVAAIGIAILLVRGGGKEISPTDHDKAAAGSSAASAKPSASTSAAVNETPQASASTAPETTASAAATTTGEGAGAQAPTKESKEPVAAAKENTAAPPPMPKAAAAHPPSPPQETPNVFAPAPVAEFNMGEARSRLSAIASGVQTCKRGDTVGSGRVEIVFAPSGAVQSANLQPGTPFDGTPTGKCVEARFRGARVPAFGGSPFTVTKSFSIN
jgi:predicted Zn finger-like uncharacterized protein